MSDVGHDSVRKKCMSVKRNEGVIKEREDVMLLYESCRIVYVIHTVIYCLVGCNCNFSIRLTTTAKLYLV